MNRRVVYCPSQDSGIMIFANCTHQNECEAQVKITSSYHILCWKSLSFDNIHSLVSWEDGSHVRVVYCTNTILKQRIFVLIWYVMLGSVIVLGLGRIMSLKNCRIAQSTSLKQNLIVLTND